MKVLSDTGHMTVRHLMALWRQPWWIAVSLVQPVIWLLLFGALFEAVTDIPGFGSTNYIEFLAPGVVVMTAFFGAGWAGMPVIEDINRGVIDRFLVSPVRRSSLISGRLTSWSLTTAIQSLIIVVLALIVGASFANGVLGVLVLIIEAVLVGAAFGCLSIGLALLIRKEETLIAAVQFLVLPLSFMSVTFMQKSLMPGWMQTVADFNPLNWAVEAGRDAVTANPDWGAIAGKSGLLLAFLLICGTFALRAFRTYQRTV
ncbi:MAG: ABC transporter permease [Actinobacteria bacterium]|nr:ABC transporter permease [Actinomycetota bacterium]